MEQWRRENGRFVPQMANWLRGERWKDPLTPVEERQVKERELQEAQAQREKERREADTAKIERLRPLFRAFAVKFGPTAENNAFAGGLWMYLHGKGMAPSPDDVPDDNTLGIVDFINAFKAKREQEAWIAAHPGYGDSAASASVPLETPRRENGAVSSGDFLRARGLLDTFLKRQEAVCHAV
jgi:hypothetical protein